MTETIIAIVLVGFLNLMLAISLNNKTAMWQKWVHMNLTNFQAILIKGGEFKGTCASQNPYLNPKGEECGYCGKTVTPGTDCKKG